MPTAVNPASPCIFEQVTKNCEVLFLAVKPQYVTAVGATNTEAMGRKIMHIVVTYMYSQHGPQNTLST